MLIVPIGINAKMNENGKTFEYDGLGELRAGQFLFSYVLIDPVPFAQTGNKTIFLTTADASLMGKITNTRIEPGRMYVMKFFNEFREDEATESTRLNFEYAGRAIEMQCNSEIIRLARSKHPNVAHIVDFGKHVPVSGSRRTSPLQYFVEEYVDGVDMNCLMKMSSGADAAQKQELLSRRVSDASGMLSIDFIIRSMYEAARGLLHLHECGIAHGDLRPANMVVGGAFPKFPYEGPLTTVLTDLGSASELGNTKYYQLGSMIYRPPELVKALESTPEGKIPYVRVKTPGDRWALGVTLYQMLTGQYPYGMTVTDWTHLSPQEFKEAKDEMMRRIIKEKLVAPSKITNSDRFSFCASPISAERDMDELVRSLLQRNPSGRVTTRHLVKNLSELMIKHCRAQVLFSENGA